MMYRPEGLDLTAPARYAAWLGANRHFDKNSRAPSPYHYHPRSNAASVLLAKLVMEDIYASSKNVQDRVARREAAYGVNIPFRFPDTGEEKRLDLAIGIPDEPVLVDDPALPLPLTRSLRRVFVAVEAKAAMTEHIGAKPRLWDELSSSHEIVHRGDQQAIAAGVTVVNISDVFVSPLRQRPGEPLVANRHNQPHDAEDLLRHLRRLRIRDAIGEVGFDAYCHIVVKTDNVTGCELWTEYPAPQVGDPDHYDTFVSRLADLFDRRFP
jgi:hypothetical protein